MEAILCNLNDLDAIHQFQPTILGQFSFSFIPLENRKIKERNRFQQSYSKNYFKKKSEELMLKTEKKSSATNKMQITSW